MTRKSRCHHQWSRWSRSTNSEIETKWCHVCNAHEERPRAYQYQPFRERTLPKHIKNLPVCTTPGCIARA